tara:strand:- start:993 stop:2357 length:1365 start_codon:yes stop_codon:yes gene_type:complete
MKILTKKINTFEVILLVFIIFFSIILFLSIPALFDYERYKDKIKKQIFDEYKITLSNIREINYSFLPSPHLKIENVTFSFNKEKEEIAKIKNLEIYISLAQLYNQKRININKIKIIKSNFYLDKKTIQQFKNHFLKNISGPVEIVESILFYLDKKKEVVAISPVRNIKYYIDLKSKEKKIKIKGRIFDIPYNFVWTKNYKNPKITTTLIDFKNPNININNISENISSEESKGNLSISYFRNNILLKYKYFEKLLEIESVDKKNNIKVNGNLSLSPFHFDVGVFFEYINLDYIFDFIFLKIYQFKNTIHHNVNGNLNIYFDELLNDNFKSGLIKINIDKKKLNILENNLEINNIGKIYFEDIDLKEINTKLYLISKIKISILNKKNFYSKFNVPKKNKIDLKKINFILEKNIDEDLYYISNVKINGNLVKNSNKYLVSNLQQLRKVVKKEFENLN